MSDDQKPTRPSLPAVCLYKKNPAPPMSAVPGSLRRLARVIHRSFHRYCEQLRIGARAPRETTAASGQVAVTSCFSAALTHCVPFWLKSDQAPQSHMVQGLRRCVLSLSTGGCTVDVGKCHWRLRSWDYSPRATLAGKASLGQRIDYCGGCNTIRPRLMSDNWR